ncbi:MAG: sialidase family protein, partial [Deltaproteobacteria bacterium]
TLEETDPSLTFDPSGLHDPLVAYAGYFIMNGVSYWRGGFSHLAADMSFLSAHVVRDHDFPDVTLVNVRYDHAGRLHLVFFAENTDRPGNPVRYASSDDGGATFTTPVYLFPQGHCLLRCETPAMAIGPADTARETVYATMTEYLGNGTTTLQFAAAPVTSGVFSPLVSLAEGEIAVTARRSPRVSAITAGPGAGFVAAVWIAQNMDNGLAPLGDPLNRVRVRVSHDGGATFGPMSEVARATDSPVGLPPGIEAGPGVLHVVYATGGLDGAWNVVLATSRDDGATWLYRVVNDDAPCATHAWASLAVDPVSGDAHVLFLDNRFWPGEVVYSRCPADATQRCARNELVSGEAFALSTTQDATRWLGSRSALRFAPDGTLWAAWADTRSGGPGIYVSRGRPVAR